MKLSIRKGHVVLAALVVALGVAVYLNWNYTESGGFVEPVNGTSKETEQNEKDPGKAEETANYGDAYFVEARLSRTQSRDEAMDAVKYMLEDAKLDEKTMLKLTNQATALALRIEKEGKIENILKAKGFSECMVYLDEQKADVIVKSDGLTDSEAAQVMDAVLSEAKIPHQNISIIEIK